MKKKLKQLRLWSLEERRNNADVIEVFKMSKGLSQLPFNTFFEVSQDSRTRGHMLKMLKHRQRLNMRKHCFAERVVNRWKEAEPESGGATEIQWLKE